MNVVLVAYLVGLVLDVVLNLRDANHHILVTQTSRMKDARNFSRVEAAASVKKVMLSPVWPVQWARILVSVLLWHLKKKD